MIKVGEQAPDFELLNQDGERVRLSDYRGKTVIMFSFPKADSMGCNMQACAFRDEFPQIAAENAVVFGIGVQPPDEMKRWQEKKKLPYDILSDADHSVLTTYGAWGIDVFSFVKIPFVNRSYWVIDEKGVLIDMQLNVGPKESLEKALSTIKGVRATV